MTSKKCKKCNVTYLDVDNNFTKVKSHGHIYFKGSCRKCINIYAKEQHAKKAPTRKCGTCGVLYKVARGAKGFFCSKTCHYASVSIDLKLKFFGLEDLAC